MDIQVLIRKLVSYGVQTGLVPEEDVIYTTNRLLELFARKNCFDVSLFMAMAELK